MWTLLLTASLALAAPLDRIVTVVNDHVILDSDVRIDAELAAVDASPLPFWRDGTPLTRQVDAAVIDSAAGDVGLYRPTEQQVVERVEAIGAAFDSREAFEDFRARWSLGTTELLAIARLRLRVEAFLRRNIAAPPDQPERFARETEALLDQLRARARIRPVPEGG